MAKRHQTFEDVLAAADPEVRRELAAMCVAYCQATNIPPDQAQLNVRRTPKGVRYFYSRIREPGANPPAELVPKPRVHIFGEDL